MEAGIEWMAAITARAMAAAAEFRTVLRVDRGTESQPTACIGASARAIDRNQPPLPAAIGKLRGGPRPPRFFVTSAAQISRPDRPLGARRQLCPA